MHVVDAVLEFADEEHRINLLPMQVAGVEVEPEGLAVANGLQRPLGRIDVEGDLGGMDFQAEPHTAFVVDIQDRVEHFGEVGEALVDGLVGNGRKAVEHVPDRGSGESIDDVEAQVLGGPGRVLQRLDGPGALFLRIAGRVGGREGIRARIVVGIADELAREVIGDGEELQSVLVEDVALLAAVGEVFGSPEYIHVVAPASEFEAVVPP